MEHARGVFGCIRLSERRACRVVQQSRSTQRRTRRVPDNEPRLGKRLGDFLSLEHLLRYWSAASLWTGAAWDGARHKQPARAGSLFPVPAQACQLGWPGTSGVVELIPFELLDRPAALIPPPRLSGKILSWPSPALFWAERQRFRYNCELACAVPPSCSVVG